MTGATAVCCATCLHWRRGFCRHRREQREPDDGCTLWQSASPGSSLMDAERVRECLRAMRDALDAD